MSRGLVPPSMTSGEAIIFCINDEQQPAMREMDLVLRHSSTDYGQQQCQQKERRKTLPTSSSNDSESQRRISCICLIGKMNQITQRITQNALYLQLFVWLIQCLSVHNMNTPPKKTNGRYSQVILKSNWKCISESNQRMDEMAESELHKTHYVLQFINLLHGKRYQSTN